MRVFLYAMILTAATLSCSREALRSAAPPWPEWAFHHWVWFDDPDQCLPGQTAQECYIQMVGDYLRRDIPVGAIIIDSPWETGYNTYDIDTALFPNPQEMIRWFHDRNVRVFLWTTSMVNVDTQVEKALHDEGAAGNFFLTAGEGMSPAILEWWKGNGSLIDFFNPEAVAWWHSLMDRALTLGIDGWKCDGAEYGALLKPLYSPYLKRNVKRLEYSRAYYRDFFDYSREKLGDDRIITARPVDTYGYEIGEKLLEEWASFAPREINWAGWVGDQDPTFDGMRAALVNMRYSSKLGYIAFGSDIGGYREDTKDFGPLGRTKEVFLRWAQMGSVCPVMENGGGGEHRPWKFDDETTQIYRTFVTLHEALVPYLMREGALAWAERLSLMRFLPGIQYQYLLGRDVFVAPILAGGGTVSISFPTGFLWVYLFDRTRVFQGGAVQSMTFPLSEYPIFLKKGSSLEKTLRFP